MFVKRVERDDALIAGLEADVTAFLEELTHKLNQLEKLNVEQL